MCSCITAPIYSALSSTRTTLNENAAELTNCLSAAVWAGTFAGLGASFLAGKGVLDLTLVAAGTTFAGAATMTIVTLVAIPIVFAVTLSVQMMFRACSDNPCDFGSLTDSDKLHFMRNWTWTAALPILATANAASVPVTTVATLLAFGALGIYAKYQTVSLYHGDEYHVFEILQNTPNLNWALENREHEHSPRWS